MHPSRRLRKAVGKQTVLRRGVYPRRGPSASRNNLFFNALLLKNGFEFYDHRNVAVHMRSGREHFVCLSLLLSPEGGEGSGPYRHSNSTMSVAAEEDSSDQRSTETSQREITTSFLEWCLYEKVLDRDFWESLKDSVCFHI